MWSDEQWGSLLERWERALQARESRPLGSGEEEPTPFRRPGANVADVEALERRIGRRLPPSYRSFLLVTDGFRAAGWGAARPFESADYDGLLPATAVTTLAWADPVTVMSWAVPGASFGGDLFEPEDAIAFLSLDEETRYEHPPLGHLIHAIAASGPQQHGNVVLDPLVVDAAGEWEAWRWDADGCTRFASFGDLVEQLVDEAEREAASVAPTAPAAVRSEAEEAVARLESADDVDVTAIEQQLRERCLDGPASERMPWIVALGNAPGPRATALTIALLREHPDDAPLVGNLVQTSGGWFGTEAAVGPVRSALRSAQGRSLTDIVHRWPEPIEQEYAATGDSSLLDRLLFAGRPGSLIAAVEALARPDLNPDVRASLSYTLSHATARHPDLVAPEELSALGDTPGVSRFHLVQALIPLSHEAAVAMLERALTEGTNADKALGTIDYAFWALASGHLADAVPALAAYLGNDPAAQHAPLVLRTLACLDHPQTVPAVAAALDGPHREHALLALEQVAVSAEMVCAERGRAALAEAASSQQAASDVLRSLARARHPAAVEHLLARLTSERRTAIEGMADVESPGAVAALHEAALDPDDETAAIAIHGLLRARSAGIEVLAEPLATAIDGFGVREHPAALDLATRWLTSTTPGSPTGW